MAIESVHPATGERLAGFTEMAAADLEPILDAAVKAQRLWARTPFDERAIPIDVRLRIAGGGIVTLEVKP